MGRRQPPDGGWGWVMVAAAFVCHILGGAVFGALGVLYVAWLDEFGQGKALTSWIIALAFGVLFSIGPVASSLSNRFSCKTVAIVGSFMNFGGYVVSCWAPSVPFLMVFIGLVSGAGSGFIFIPCVAVVTSYFKKNLPVATGIYTSGVGLGSFILGPLVNYLDNMYGWRGALFIIGAIVLHTLPASLLFTPFSEETDSDKESNEEANSITDVIEQNECEQKLLSKGDENPKEDISTTLDESEKTGVNGTAVCLPNSDSSIDHSHKPGGNVLLLAVNDKNISAGFDQNQDPGVNNSLTNVSTPVPVMEVEDRDIRKIAFAKRGLYPGPCAKSVQCLKAEASDERAHNSLNDLRKKKSKGSHLLQPENLFQNHSHSHKELSRSLRNFDIYALSSLKNLVKGSNIDKDGEKPILNVKSEEDVQKTQTDPSTSNNENAEDKSMCGNFRIMHFFLVSTELLRDRTFLLLFISNFFTCLSYSTPLIFIVDRAIDYNIDKTWAAALISITGVGNILGRLTFGIIADHFFSDSLMCFIGVIGINGVSTMMSPLCGESIVLHGIYAFVYGLNIGAFAVLAVMVTVELMGRDRVASAFGLYLLSAGLGSVLGPPLGGWLFDVTKTYNLTYIVTGSFTLFSAIILLPVEISRIRRRALPFDDQ